jgi:phosphopantetheinyl transferase (holo-ACP synthase)
MEVCHKESGEPFVVLHDGGVKLLAERSARKVHISLSHLHGHAVAMAILED